MRFFAINLVLVVATSVFAAPPAAFDVPKGPLPKAYRHYKAICRINTADGQGSGTLIGIREDGTALVLSCRHVNQKVGRVVTVTWPLAGNQKSAGVVYDVVPGIYLDTDFALVVCQRPMGVDPIKLATFDPHAAPFVGAGWRDRQLRVAIADVAALRGQSLSLVRTPSPFVGGMSGGCLFNRFGEQIAVIVASDRETWGMSVDGPMLHRLVNKYRSGQ